MIKTCLNFSRQCARFTAPAGLFAGAGLGLYAAHKQETSGVVSAAQYLGGYTVGGFAGFFAARAIGFVAPVAVPVAAAAAFLTRF